MFGMMVDPADKIIDRINAIYDNYMKIAADALEQGEVEDLALVKEAVLIDSNFARVNMMYTLMTEEEFVEAFAPVLNMDDCDVLNGLLNIDNLWERRHHDERLAQPEAVHN